MSKIDRFAPHIDITGFFGGKASKEKYNTYKNYFEPQTASAARLFRAVAGTGLKLT